MNTKSRMNSMILIVAIFTSLLLSQQSAHAVTLIFDDFDGSNSTNLVGTTADVGGVWTGASNSEMKASGTINGGANRRTAYQAFSLVPGAAYTLSADVTLDSGSAAFIAIGFANSVEDGDEEIWNDANPHAWMYSNVEPHGVKTITGPDLTGESSQLAAALFDTPRNLKIVLDTTNAANYLATWFLDGSQIDSRSIGAPALTHVFINRHTSTSGIVDNFLLTDNTLVVPETSSLVLMSLGLSLIIFQCCRLCRRK